MAEKQAASAMTSASQRALFQDQAVFLFEQFFKQVADPDQTLEKAGILRKDLKKLTKDAEIFQCILKRNNSIVETPWRLEPYDQGAKFVWEEIQAHVEKILVASVNAALYGYSVVETVYKAKGNKIGIAEIKEKPFEWFAPARSGELYLIHNESYKEILCDPRKFILIQSYATYENPFGEALLSRLWWDIFRKFNLWTDWSLFIERFAAPMLVGKTDGDVDEFNRVLESAIRGATITVGSSDEVVAISATKGGEPFELLNAVINSTIQKIILGQTLTSDVGDVGSYSAAKVHLEIQKEVRNSDIRNATKAAQHLVNQLCLLNGMRPPTFVMEDDTGLEMERAQRDALLVEKGIIKLTEKYVLDRYDYEPGDFEIVKQEPPAPTNIPNQKDGKESQNNMHVCFSSDVNLTPEQMAIEQVADSVIAKLAAPLNEKAIASAIKSAKNPQDLEDRLAVILKNADLSEYQQTLEKALFACDLMGYAHAGSGITETVQAQAPTINVTAPITIAMPEQPATVVNASFAESQPPIINIQMPEQPPPIVNVTAEAAAPIVTVQPSDVHIAPSPAPIVNVEANPVVTVNHPKRAVQKVERNADDEIVKTVTDYE